MHDRTDGSGRERASDHGPEAGLERTVERVCAAALDAAAAVVERPRTGNSKRTALVTLDGGREVVVQYVRCPTGGRAVAGGHPLAAEAAVGHVLAERTDVPVARVLADGTLDDPPVAYLVTDRAPGVDLHERFTDLAPAARAGLARTLGWHLAAVHDAVRFDAPGQVGVRDGELVVPEPLPAAAFYREYLEAGLADWPDALDDLAPRVRDALGGRLDDLPADPRLFPWDYRPGNVVVRGNGNGTAGNGAGADGRAAAPPTVSAVLDWGEPLAAHPGLSAAKATFTLADWYVAGPAAAALHRAFREGYRAVRPYPEEGAAAFRLLGLVASAADARGRVTRPRYPTVEGDEAVAFHRDHLERALERLA